MATAGQTWYEKAEWACLQRADFPYAFAEDVVVRYTDLTDARDLESKVTYIQGLPDTSALVVNNETVAGTWTTLGASYEPVNPNNPGGAIRLMHMLMPAGLTTGTGFYITDNGCDYRVSLSFFWRLKTFPPALPDSTSGVQYSIGSVARDPRSGLWSCVMEKRETISQTTGQWKFGETLFATTMRRVWKGLRTGDLTDTGATAELDAVGNPSAGVLVTEDRTKNPDCTQDVSQDKTTAKEVLSKLVTKAWDLFRKTTVTRSVATTALGDPIAPAGGVVYQHTNDKREDGKVDTAVEKTEEQTVNDATVSKSEDTFFTEETRIGKSQVAATDVSGNPTPGVLITDKADKTPGALYDNTVTTRTAKSVASAVVSFARDLYAIVTRRTDVAQAAPPTAAPEPSAGLTVKRDGKLRPDGKYDVDEDQTQERPVTNAMRRVSKTRYVGTVEYKSRSQAADLADPATPGVTVVNEKTGGALVDQTKVTATPEGGGAGVEEQTSTLWENTRKIITQIMRGKATKLPEPTAETDGVVKNISNVYDDLGAIQTQEVTDTAIKKETTQLVPDSDGQYQVYIGENLTIAELGVALGSLPSIYKNSAQVSLARYPGRYNLSVISRNEAGGTTAFSYTTTGTEHHVQLVHKGGLVLKELYRIDYTTQRGWGVNLGRAAYAALDPKVNWGSSFDDAGRGWYWFKAVTSVSCTTADVTAAYLGAGVTL